MPLVVGGEAHLLAQWALRGLPRTGRADRPDTYKNDSHATGRLHDREGYAELQRVMGHSVLDDIADDDVVAGVER
jgi:hypothetical protein